MARARGDIANGFQPGAAQAAGDGDIGAERRDRQRADGLGLLAIGNDFAGDMTRHGARADRGAGNRGADDKTLPGQRAAQHLQQRALAAEQMGAAGDVEIQPMRGIERHQRREAIAPVGDIAKRLGVGDRIGIEHRQFRTDGAGIGERQADLEAETRRGIIERIDLQRVVLFGDDDGGGWLHLSRLRGHTNSLTRGDTPTPTLPRKRERERTVRVARALLDALRLQNACCA